MILQKQRVLDTAIELYGTGGDVVKDIRDC